MRKSVENISLLQKQINDLQLENQILKNILERSGISYTLVFHIHMKFPISVNPKTQRSMIRIRGRGLSIRDRLRMKWQIYFMPDSGGGRMSMRREVKRQAQEKQDTIHSVIIAGRISALKCAMRK